MDTTEAQNGRRDWGTHIIRMLGVLLIAAGLCEAYSVVRDLTSGFHGTINSSAIRAQFNCVLGYWPVFGWWACVVAALTCIVPLFAGVQLARLRRSGWIVALIFLAYWTLSLALWLGSEHLQKAVENAYSARVADQGIVSILVQDNQYKIDHANRIGEFALACCALSLFYLVSEWWRFWGKRGWYATPRLSYAKAGICVILLALVSVWTFWAAEYVFERSILSAARAPTLQITPAEAGRLSLRAKREMYAILIRRLAAERTSVVAGTVEALGFFDDPSLLNAEDIPAILDAARSSSAQVRTDCYRLLVEIGTREAENCLRDAVDKESVASGAWNVAVQSLGGLRPSTAPEVLLKLATEKSDQRSFCISNLGKFEDPRALPILCEALHDADPEIRRAAISALRGYPCMQSERALQAELADKEIELRGSACLALVDIGTEESVLPLIAVLKESADSYRVSYEEKPVSLHEWASCALERITGEDFANDAAQWEKWWKKAGPPFDLRESLAKRLFTPIPQQPKEIPKSAEELVANPAFKARFQAISQQGNAQRVIRSHGMRSLAGELAKFLRLPDEQAPLKLTAAQTLTTWGYREGIEWMIEYVDNDTGEGARMFAIRPLGRACGVNYFSDKKRWREWWSANRLRFPSAAR